MLDLKATAKALRADSERLAAAANALEGGRKQPGRVLSKEARERIAEAQRQRWAKARKRKAA